MPPATFSIDTILNSISKSFFGIALIVLAINWFEQSSSLLVQTWYHLALLYIIVFAARSSYEAFNRKSGSKVNWNDEIVVITGGASGMGLLTAETLAARDAKVVVLDIKPVVSKARIMSFLCDVSDPTEIERVGEQIIQNIGHPTILINNAGIVHGKTIVDLSTAEIQLCLNTNLLAHFLTIKQFLPHMLQTDRGHIVTVASAVGLAGCSQASIYCATKAALISLHESLRYELCSHHGSRNIKTTLLCPGFVTTGMFDGVQFRFPFLTPVLEPSDVVSEVAAALDAKRGRRIYMPFYVNLMGLLRFLPEFCADFIHQVTGADESMKTWTGRVY